MKRIGAVVLFGLLSVTGCSKTVYVTTTVAPGVSTSATITTTTMVSFSNDLRKAAASCLDSMPELSVWDSAPMSPGWERNIEECREFRILGLAEKTNSKLLAGLTLDLDEYLATVQYLISWMDQCERAAKLEDPEGSLELSLCGGMGMQAESDLPSDRSRASRITENLQAFLSQ